MLCKQGSKCMFVLKCLASQNFWANMAQCGKCQKKYLLLSLGRNGTISSSYAYNDYSDDPEAKKLSIDFMASPQCPRLTKGNIEYLCSSCSNCEEVTAYLGGKR